MKLNLLVLSCVTGMIAAGQTVGPLSGTIAGVVLDGNGPVSGSTIYFHTQPQMVTGRMGVPTPVGRPVMGSVVSDPSGNFSITGLSPDVYYLCARPIASDQLATCAWSGGELPVVVVAGRSSDVKLSLRAGAVVTINVSDPDNRIIDLADLRASNNPVPLTGGNFSIGAMSGIAFGQANLVSRQPGSRVYQLAVPRDALIKLLVSTTLAVADDKGKPVRTGVPSDSVSEANGDRIINISVR